MGTSHPSLARVRTPMTNLFTVWCGVVWGGVGQGGWLRQIQPAVDHSGCGTIKRHAEQTSACQLRSPSNPKATPPSPPPASPPISPTNLATRPQQRFLHMHFTFRIELQAWTHFDGVRRGPTPVPVPFKPPVGSSPHWVAFVKKGIWGGGLVCWLRWGDGWLWFGGKGWFEGVGVICVRVETASRIAGLKSPPPPPHLALVADAPLTVIEHQPAVAVR